MRGMLYRDRKGLLGWMTLGFAAMMVFFPIGQRTQAGEIVFVILLQVFAMQPVRNMVQADRRCGWFRQTELLPWGRRWYTAEKYLLLLFLIPALLAGTYLGSQWYYYQLYGEVVGMLLLPRADFAFVYFCVMTGLQMPVLFLAGRYSFLWESITWGLSFPMIMWLDNGRMAAYQLALWQGKTPETVESLEYLRWYEAGWETMKTGAAVFFVLSGVLTIWLSGYVREEKWVRHDGRSGKTQFFLENGKRALVFCGITAAVLVVVWFLDARTPQRDIYIYEKPFWKGGVTYLVTHNDPDEIAERFPAEDYTHIGTYMAYNAFAEIAGGIDGTFLIWDNEWFLWELDTGEKTTVAIPYDRYEADVQLLGSAEPEVAALVWKGERTKDQLGVTAFYSIRENRMITDFAYGSYADDLQDGRIAAEDAEGNWVLLDTVTGEVLDSLPGRP